MKHSFYLILPLLLIFSIVGDNAFGKSEKDKEREQRIRRAAVATAIIVAAQEQKERDDRYRYSHYKYDDYRYDNHWDNRHHDRDDDKGKKIAAGVAAAVIATAVVVAAQKNKEHDRYSYYDYDDNTEWDPVYKSVVRYPRHDVKCFDNTRLCWWTTDSGLIKEISNEWTKRIY